MSIRFEYLYRDAGNNKNWGEVVFANPRHLSAKAIAEMAAEALIDEYFFVARKVGVRNVHFPDYDDELDHGWHEVHAFVGTSEAPTDEEQRDIEEFIEAIREGCSSVVTYSSRARRLFSP